MGNINQGTGVLILLPFCHFASYTQFHLPPCFYRLADRASMSWRGSAMSSATSNTGARQRAWRTSSSGQSVPPLDPVSGQLLMLHFYLYLHYLHVHVFSPPHSWLQEFAYLKAMVKEEPQSPGGPSHLEPAPTGGTQGEGAPGDQPPVTKEEQPGEVAPAKEDPGKGDPPPHSDVSTPAFNFRYQSGAQYSAPPSGCSLFPVRS